MQLLLDTHTFCWWHGGKAALSQAARTAITDPRNEKYVSAVTAWEIITKFRTGREPGFAALAADVSAAVMAQGFNTLPIAMRHAEASSNLPLHHRDPRDRILIAQALIEDMTVMTMDPEFRKYTAKLL